LTANEHGRIDRAGGEDQRCAEQAQQHDRERAGTPIGQPCG
jgi:hypothetical protein